MFLRSLSLVALMIGGAADAQTPAPIQNLGTPAHVAVSNATATLIEPARQRLQVSIEVDPTLGNQTVVCIGGSAAVTLTTGWCLPAVLGSTIVIPNYSGPIYGLSTTSPTTVDILDLY